MYPSLENSTTGIATWQGLRGDQSLPKHSFGHGSGGILLDDLDCTGNEASVVQCKHTAWGTNNCNDEGKKHEWLGITCLVSIFIFMFSRLNSCHLEVFK